MRDDVEFNEMFCELIETYPQLYDYTRPDYSNRSVQDKAWRKIAAQLNETVINCKERWKNIRGRYSKYRKIVRSSDSGAKQVAEYYLASRLLFLDKFLKTRPAKGNLVLENTKVEEVDDSVSVEAEYRDLLREDSCSSSSELSPPLRQGTSRMSPTPPAVAKCEDNRKRKAGTDVQDANESASKYYLDTQNLLEHKLAKVGELDADMAFLQSLLPDMKAMTAQQKRKFKIGVLKLCDELLEQHSQVRQPPLPSHK
ncbi:uncharacterized protein LOC126101228 [Schistocerca cancellata]|uniref:uncharacterized protein LOC126101228 n=1 Tax=Schistocerca cancellata TaxID=274614 RepID=UPI00211928F8|nr:uncharacterized protein LOC126101228 [Schistocerca cancellata]